MIQLILHLLGDYCLQSDWMAQKKTSSSWAAFCHATVYALPFLAIASFSAWLVIWITHFFIDRFRLARYVVWVKNVLLQPRSERIERRTRWLWANCQATGYPSDAPPWLAVWLLIAADNTLHLAINALAIAWLN